MKINKKIEIVFVETC